MPNMQVTIGFRGKSGMNPTVIFIILQIFANYLVNKISGGCRGFAHEDVGLLFDFLPVVACDYLPLLFINSGYWQLSTFERNTKDVL